jgi:hypothetical protein
MAGALVLLIAVSCASNDESEGVPVTTDVGPTITPGSAIASSSTQLATPTSSVSEELAGDRLDCTDPISELASPPDGFQVIDGVVALQTIETSSRPLQLGRTVATESGELQFAKTGLIVRSGTEFEIVVSPPPGVQAFVSWGNTGKGQPTQLFMVGPCEAQATWIAFPGGYFVSEAACVDLIVKHRNIDNQVSVGVGASCDGQASVATNGT